MKRIERKNAKLCLQLLQYLAGIFTTKKAHLPFEDSALHHKGALICTNKIKHLCHVAHLHKQPPLQFQEWDVAHGFPSQISCLELKPVQAPSITEKQRSHYTDILYHRNISNQAALSKFTKLQLQWHVCAGYRYTALHTTHSFHIFKYFSLKTLFLSPHSQNGSVRIPTAASFTFNVRETPNPVH